MKHRVQRWPLTIYPAFLRRFYFGTQTDSTRLPDAESLRKRRRVWVRFSVSIFSVILAAAIRISLDPVLGDRHAYTFFFASVALTAWYAGFWPSIFAVTMSFLLADWFFIVPIYSFDFKNWTLSDFLGLGGFFCSGLAIAFTSKALHSAKERAEFRRRELEKAQAELEQHAKSLEHRVSERTAELSESILSLETVCYQMAHNLRAPLRAMDGFARILAEDYVHLLDEEGRAYNRRISDAAKQMDVLINGLLDYGMIGHVQIQLRVVNLETEVDRVLWKHRDEILSRNAEIKIARPLPSVLGNSFLVGEILTRLLSNALKFVSPGVSPQISIAARLDGDTVVLQVNDNGTGIPSRYLNKTFQPFESLHDDPAYQGAGIGLAIAIKAARRMKGQMGVESSLGKGSQFWFKLPKAPRDLKSSN